MSHTNAALPCALTCGAVDVGRPLGGVVLSGQPGDGLRELHAQIVWVKVPVERRGQSRVSKGGVREEEATRAIEVRTTGTLYQYPVNHENKEHAREIPEGLT